MGDSGSGVGAVVLVATTPADEAAEATGAAREGVEAGTFSHREHNGDGKQCRRASVKDFACRSFAHESWRVYDDLTTDTAVPN